jgi:hypothetical protein
MHSNWQNTGNNLPAGYADNGERLDNIGLSGRYHRNIHKWEQQHEAELSKLKQMIATASRHPDHVFDAEFCAELEAMKAKYPAQARRLEKYYFDFKY